MTQADYQQKKDRERNKYARRDIKVIDDAILSNDDTKMRDVHLEMDAKYQAAIDKWGEGMYGYVNEFGFNMEFVCGDSLIDNLNKMKYKIQAYGEGRNLKETSSTGNINIDVSSNSESKASSSIDIAATFNLAKEKLYDLTALSDTEIQDLQEQLDELQAIANSDEKQRDKWKKAIPIFKYVLDKGIDVAKIILPLVTNLS